MAYVVGDIRSIKKMNDISVNYEFQDVFLDDLLELQVLKRYSYRNCLIRDWNVTVGMSKSSHMLRDSKVNILGNESDTEELVTSVDHRVK